MTSKDVLAALLRDRLHKDDALAAKQRRLLLALGATQQAPDERDQQGVADAVAARPSKVTKNQR